MNRTEINKQNLFMKLLPSENARQGPAIPLKAYYTTTGNLRKGIGATGEGEEKKIRWGHPPNLFR
jgi:hypothetical protein